MKTRKPNTFKRLSLAYKLLYISKRGLLIQVDKNSPDIIWDQHDAKYKGPEYLLFQYNVHRAIDLPFTQIQQFCRNPKTFIELIYNAYETENLQTLTT